MHTSETHALSALAIAHDVVVMFALTPAHHPPVERYRLVSVLDADERRLCLLLLLYPSHTQSD